MKRLIGETLTYVHKTPDDEEIHFKTAKGDMYKMLHYTDCCESVYVDDVCGDLQDLVGSPILSAEEVSSCGDGDNFDHPIMKEESLKSLLKQETFLDTADTESVTWTFYKIDTNKGGVVIRWVGSSNGYYSEAVSFEAVTSL